MTDQKTGQRHSRWRRWLSQLVFWGGMATAPVAAMAAPQADIPPHWMSYARLVSNQFQVWLQDGSHPDAMLLHDWIERRTLAQNGRPPAPVVVRAWISSSGDLTALRVSAAEDAQVDQWLARLLTGRRLTEAPPRDMPQPLVLRLNLAQP